MIRIYADFNSCDESGRVCLNTVGSLADIERLGQQLYEGMEVVFYMPSDFEVRGRLVFDGIWLGIPDWSTIQYYEPQESNDHSEVKT